MSGTDLTGIVLDVALQEWAATCRALELGRSVLIVRKGGIHERGGGLFAPEHDRFLLMPTWLHQDAARFDPAWQGCFAGLEAPPPGEIPLRLWAEVRRAWRLTELEPLFALRELLPWTRAEIEARFRYRQPLLNVLALRVHRLSAERRIADRPAYAGCRSWVRLAEAVDCARSRPVLDELAFARACDRASAVLDAI